MFTNLDKMRVIQDARAFNESPLDARKCRHILTSLLFLVYQSETLSEKEATDIFFAATKAFQSKDSSLRRLTYLVMKELSTMTQDTMMATSSLTQDIASKDPDLAALRANSIRALGKVVDVSCLGAVPLSCATRRRCLAGSSVC